jgi:hypothetical protein
MKMPGIMHGFVGPYSTAMKNIENFEVFFSMIGHVALSKSVDWQCIGANSEDLQEEVSEIDRSDMKQILIGMSLLK